MKPDDCLRGRRIVFSGHDDGGQTEIKPVERNQKRLHNINMDIFFSAADHLLRLQDDLQRLCFSPGDKGAAVEENECIPCGEVDRARDGQAVFALKFRHRAPRFLAVDAVRDKAGLVGCAGKDAAQHDLKRLNGAGAQGYDRDHSIALLSKSESPYRST